MSQRQIRKIYGGPQIPLAEDSTDEEFEPSYAQNSTKNIYAGFIISSESEESSAETVIPEKPKPAPSKQKRHKKKIKQIKTKDELDDIDQIINEINSKLGEPEKPAEIVPKRDLEKIKKELFTVWQQNLEANNELNRMFGPDEDEEPVKRGRQPNFRIIAQKSSIIKTDKVYKNHGLSMSLRETKNGYKYFVFEHSKNYQSLHTLFLRSQKRDGGEHSRVFMFPLEESHQNMHVEGLLEIADRYYMIEEYTAGNKVIEEIISYMQYCAHYCFSVTDMRTRLEYKHVENRAFHIALMKYMHMCTNKACHRTALELAKLLMNLDPSDPLAVLLIIDTIAIRAREYQWLINAIDYWKEERDAGFLFNIQYSYALANYHYARKNKESFDRADELIQQAILQFPTVLTNILKNAGIRNPKVNESDLFKTDVTCGTTTRLRDLMVMYARFIWNKFCEKAVLKWLNYNIDMLVEKYEKDSSAQCRAKEHANACMNLFEIYPPEIVRHLSILTPLNNLIADGAVPAIEPDTVVSYDPAPPLDEVNMYENIGADRNDGVNYFQIFTSMSPDYELQDPGMDYEPDLPEQLRYELQPDHGIFADDSGSELDSDDDSGDESHNHNDVFDAMGPHGPLGRTDVVRLFMELYDNIFVRMPIENVMQPPPIEYEDPRSSSSSSSTTTSTSTSSSDDEITFPSNNLLEEPCILIASQEIIDEELIDDSDDETDPVIACLPIRNAAQFYRDFGETAISREPFEGIILREISSEIDFERECEEFIAAYRSRDTENDLVNNIPEQEQNRNGYNNIEEETDLNQKENEETVDGEETQSSMDDLPPHREEFPPHEQNGFNEDNNDNMSEPSDDEEFHGGDDSDDQEEEDEDEDDDEDDEDEDEYDNEQDNQEDDDAETDDEDDEDDEDDDDTADMPRRLFFPTYYNSIFMRHSEYRRSLWDSRVHNRHIQHHRFHLRFPNTEIRALRQLQRQVNLSIPGPSADSGPVGEAGPAGGVASAGDAVVSTGDADPSGAADSTNVAGPVALSSKEDDVD